jgi:hypothetical protein
MQCWKGLAVGATLVMAACGFSPTSPFEGFDEKGTRLRGSFDSAVSALDTGVRAASPSWEGIRVFLKEKPSISIVVTGDGTFVLEGLPSGAWTVIFERDGQVVGEIRFRSVRTNQEITIVVGLTSDGEVVLLQEQRDHVSFEGECPRGAGFWCQNQGGKNPNLSQEEFEEFADEAASFFTGTVEALETREGIAAAVCNTGDQLLRQLATLALNLAANTIDRSTALTADYANVGEAFDAAVAAASDSSVSREERNRIKDVLEAINENQNTATGCDALPDDDDGGVEPPSGKVTICHIPPGNPSNAKTLTIGGSAWPAHEAHGDSMGACPGS